MDNFIVQYYARKFLFNSLIVYQNVYGDMMNDVNILLAYFYL